jgi:signal transduction histidine kinase/PAS domain-containing protein
MVLKTIRKVLKRRPAKAAAAAHHPQAALSALLTFLETASQQTSLDGLLGEALVAIAPQYQYEMGGIHLLDETGERLTLRAHYGTPAELVSRVRQLRPGEGVAGRVARQGKPMIARIPGNPLLPRAAQAHLHQLGITHQFTVPLLAHGRTLGTLSLSARRRAVPAPAEQNEIVAFAQALAMALESRRVLARTQDVAAEATAVIGHSGDMLATLSPESLILEINPAGQQLLGGEPSGQRLLEYVDRRDHELLRAALGGGLASTVQLRLAGREEPVWLELNLAVPAPASGGLAAAADITIVASGRDITARKLTELELAQRNQELFSLNKIAALAASPLALKARLPELLDRCLKVAGCDSGALYRQAANHTELVGLVSQGYSAEFLHYRPLQVIPLGQGGLGRLAQSGEIYLLEKPEDYDLPAAREVLKAEGIRSGIAVAMRSGDRTHGVLALTHHEPRSFNTYELSLITTLAHQLGAAFETQALLLETNARLAELQLLLSLGKTLSETLELEALLQATVAHLRQLMQMDGCFIWLREANDALRIAAASQGFESFQGFTAKLSDRGVAAVAIRKRELVTSAAHQERRKLQQTLLSRSGLQAVMAMPLIVRGAAIGALVFGRRSSARLFSDDEKRRAMTISQPVAIAIENARLFDATQRQQAALKALSTEVLRAQEEERRRLSRELHDGVAQSVSALKLSLVALRGKLGHSGPPLLKEFDELVLMVGDSATELRRLSADLRPPILDELGLLPTLRAHAETLARRSRLKIDFSATELPPLPAGFDINLYRMAQEGLSNILKHAKARHARVRLTADAEAVQLDISDDGAGFELAAVRPSEQGGLGLIGMRERAALFGGDLQITTEPGAGTHLTIRLPLGTA